ncbi:MAG: hypothetical protein KAJ58_01465 [Candidatus Pacebacteria bacterium]|nr:hypothetical protein [Candidatus Paceibacterota bacterium]
MGQIIKKFNLIQFLLLSFTVFPVLTYSAVAEPSSFKDLILIAVSLITAVIPVIVLLAFIYFIWGLAQYLKNTGENRDEAQHMMLGGIIGFFVMISVWGLVAILSSTLGTGTNVPTNQGGTSLLDPFIDFFSGENDPYSDWFE